jgi:ABC-type Mn2+/Zn2+ transport system ATPase subunit
LSRYRGKTICPDCNGTRLRKDAGYVKIAGKSIQDVVLMSIDDALLYFKGLELNAHQSKVCKHILPEIEQRLSYLQKVGLSYLTLNRNSNTLSGGEAQRIQLATSIGSSLVGSLYILDEPSIGLHPRDTKKLIEVLTALKNQGNTVLVVEHEEEIMRAADTRLLISRTDLDDVVALVHRQPLLKELGDWQVLAAGGRYKIDELAKAIEWPVIADLLPSDRRSSAALKSTIAKIATAHQSIELVDRAVA